MDEDGKVPRQSYKDSPAGRFIYKVCPCLFASFAIGALVMGVIVMMAFSKNKKLQQEVEKQEKEIAELE